MRSVDAAKARAVKSYRAVRAAGKPAYIALAAATVVGLLIGAGVASASVPAVTTTPEYKAAAADARRESDRVDSLTEAAAESSDVQTALQEKVSDLQGQVDDLEAAADSVKKREAAVAKKESAVAKREKAVGAAEKAQEASQITDGTFVVGTDVQPGIYKATPSGTCYFARLRDLSGGVGSIIANGLPTGPTTIQIYASDKAFESTGCGTWNKIG